MDEISAGMLVADAEGIIGMLEAIQRDATGAVTLVVVRRRNSVGSFVPSAAEVVDGVLHIDGNRRNATIDAAMTGDGIQHQATDVRELASGETLRIPVIEERLVVTTQQRDGGGIRVHKAITTRDELVELPRVHDDVEVQRVAIGQVVDVAPEVRHEGDTLIIPLLEETTVVETRLLLREEVHITRRRTHHTEQTQVTLRTEQVEVERLDDARPE